MADFFNVIEHKELLSEKKTKEGFISMKIFI